MVVFTCNHCGDSLQKPKVAKHYQFQCRNPIFVTCVDCFKDFRENEYIAHTKCVTEDQRYGSKDYVAKQSANKGERKQQAWINVVQNVLANNLVQLTGPERNLLNVIAKHENIPRKKAKFLNFIKNISGNRVNAAVVETVWSKMEGAFKQATSDSNTNGKTTDKKNGSTEENQNDSVVSKEPNNVKEEKEVNGSEDPESKKKKKSKKRQVEANDNDNGEPAAKVTKNTAEEAEETANTTENGVDKFSWKTAILEIVTAKGEVSLKKLRKKVVARYLVDFPDSTAEKGAAKFEKKLGKVTNIEIANDKVKLLSS